MLNNDYKIHLRSQTIFNQPRKNKKFNTKGYFHHVQPYDCQYLQKKHQVFEKVRQKQNKQNYVYNLPQQRMSRGYYRMKGCLVDGNDKHKRRALKIIPCDNESVQCQSSQIHSQKIVSSLFKKYMERKQKLKQKSQRSLTAVFSQIKSRGSESRQTIETSYHESRVKNREMSNKRRILTVQSAQQLQKENCYLVAIYKENQRARKNRIKTIQ